MSFANLVEIVLLVVVFDIVGARFYYTAEKWRQVQIRMRGEEPIMYRVFGFSKTSVDNPEKWIRHFRIFTVIVCLHANIFLVLAILLFPVK